MSAAAYISKHGRELEAIIADLGDSATAVAKSWALAVELARSDPSGALGALADAEVRLSHHVRLERLDSLRVIRSAMERLDRELPDLDA